VDRAAADLLKDCPAGQDPASCLQGPALASYRRLSAELQRIQRSAEPQATCAAQGDGNGDLRVNQADVAGW
jgi:hypothetical protein